jgi:23S rRNA (pseudouridine1915-N3)-methyltransferase
VIAVGKLKGPEAEIYQRYIKRLSPTVATTEIAEGTGAPAEVKRREAISILAALPQNGFAVALDLAGHAPDSAGLAALLDRWLTLTRPICFLIGGAEGLDATVIARADYVLALGPLTWPHFLVRPMLAEQLYRARAISSGHPYHRTGRP